MSKLDILQIPKKENWETPQHIFDELDKEFHFTMDVAADDKNHKCLLYHTKETDGLKQDWGKSAGPVWMNPPYGRTMKEWIKKAYEEHLKGVTVVALIPADISDTSYFWKYIYRKAKIRYIKGRLKFKGMDNKGNYITNKPAPFPSMIVVWQGNGRKYIK